MQNKLETLEVDDKYGCDIRLRDRPHDYAQRINGVFKKLGIWPLQINLPHVLRFHGTLGEG